MMRKILLLAALTAAVCVPAHSDGTRMVTLTAVTSGSYEDGVLTPRTDRFSAVLSIDERNETVVMDKVMESTREARVKEGTIFDIANNTTGSGFAGLNVSLDKMHKKMITATNDRAIEGVETYIIGEDFYGYSRAANGKFYLEWGRVEK